MKKLLMLVISFNCFAQPAGSLDTSFATNGVYENCNPYQYGGLIRITSNNKIVNFTNPNLYRIDNNGSLDSTFGISGRIDLYPILFPFNVNISAFELQNDGKMILYGKKYNSTSYSAEIFRLNENGTLDTTFNNSGHIELNFITEFENGDKLKIQSDGKILVVGVSNTSNFDVALARINTNGTLDTAFGINGYVLKNINNQLTEANCLLLLNDGKIIIAGGVNNPGLGRDIFLTRYNSNGVLDTTFGTNGLNIISTNFYSNDDVPRKLHLLNDNSIIVDGTIVNNSASGTAVSFLAKLNSNGIINSSYAVNGFYINNSSSAYGYARKQVDDKMLFCSDYNFLTNTSGFYISRINTNGTIDTSFGTNGTYTGPFQSRTAKSPSGIELQSDNKIIVCGSVSDTSDSGLCAVVLRLNPGVLSNQVFSKNITLYPNPTNDFVYFDNATLNFDSVAVYNTIGQELNSMPLSFTNNEKISLSSFSKGIYFLKFNDGNQSVTVKVIKE